MSQKQYKKAQEDLLEKLGIKSNEDKERVGKMTRREKSRLLEAAREVLKNNNLHASTEK